MMERHTLIIPHGVFKNNKNRHPYLLKKIKYIAKTIHDF